MALVAIGPVTISHGDPAFTFDASSVGFGIMSGSVGGSCSWAAAKTLIELVNEPTSRPTIKGHVGVLEWLEFDDTLLGDFTGYYVLEGFSISASQKDSLTAADVPFTLRAAFVGALA